MVIKKLIINQVIFYVDSSTGEPHNDHGPAIVYPDGTRQFYLDGHELTKKEWIESIDLSFEEKIMIAMET